MSAFPNWLQFAVRQRHKLSGCIPTGYEILLRSAEVSGIDFDSFQDEFDLDKDRKPGDPPRNNFESVAEQVRKKYPSVNFRAMAFNTGAEKVSFLESRILQQKPTLLSLSLGPAGHPNAWHIVPLVDATATHFHVLWGSTPDDKPDVRAIEKSEIARIHDEYPGGDNVAFLDC